MEEEMKESGNFRATIYSSGYRKNHQCIKKGRGRG